MSDARKPPGGLKLAVIYGNVCANAWDLAAEGGRLKVMPGADAAFRAMLEQLCWLVGALKTARYAQSYALAA